MKIDVVIPVYRPGKRFEELLKRLEKQTIPVNRIIIMNTEKPYWDSWILNAGTLPENLSVFHLTREEFDHGATRDAAIRKSDADVCVLMTDDALPYNDRLLENLSRALLSDERIAAAYAKQLPDRDCGVIERYTRSFNYPDQGRIKTAEDIPKLGIKTFFCSNVCAAYRRERYLLLGGFTKKTIFNEDMIFAAGAIKNGYAIAYAADAEVIHSHNYSGPQQFHRNFDLAVSQADHPEVFAGIRSEGEGIRLVKSTASYLIKNKKAFLLPRLIYMSGCKYLGYRMGKRYKKLPRRMILWCTMNKSYWTEKVSSAIM